MNLWRRSLTCSTRTHPTPRRKARRRILQLESLEDRLLPTANFVPGIYDMPQVSAETQPGIFNGGPIEPLVSINPTDPANIVISSQNGLKVSTNGAATFSSLTTFPDPAGSTNNSGDTATAFDSTGRLFWANLAQYPSQRDVAVTEINPTTGATIGTTVRVPNPNTQPSDKEYLAADTNPNSPHRDNLYLSFEMYNSTDDEFEVFVSRSTDHGATWSTPMQLSVNSGVNSEGFTWPSTVNVAPNGDVYVAYHAQPDLTDTDVEGGERDLSAVPLTTVTKGNNPNGVSGEDIVFRSTDGGATFAQRSVALTAGHADITYNRQTAANGRNIAGANYWTMGSAQPWVLADPARPGNVYVIAADDPNDGAGGTVDRADVVIARSTDDGNTWSSPQTVEAGSNVAGVNINSFQLFPTAAIDQSGDIVVAWYDNRRSLVNSNGHYFLDVFARYSTDGGVTWSDAFQVNSTNMDPDPGAVNRFDGPPATTRIGEYFGIAISNGTAYVDWRGNTTDSSGTPNGEQVSMASFQINGSLDVTVPSDSSQHTITFEPVATGPFNYLEILDTVSGSTVREYAGMGDYLNGITLHDQSSNDFIDIEKVFFHDNINVNFESHGGIVGISQLQQDLDNIAGNVNVSGGTGSTLSVFDTNDLFAGDTWTITNSSINRFGSGLISYSAIDGMQVLGGDLGATYNVLSTSAATASHVIGGHGPDVINVKAESGFLGIDNSFGTDKVTIGNKAPMLGGNLAGITGQVFVGSTGGQVNLFVDDSGDSTGRSATISPTAITGLAPGEIDVNPGDVISVVVLGGSGPDTFHITSPTVTATINGGGGADTLIGPDVNSTWTINGAGAGSVDKATFSTMETLKGGSGADLYRFQPGGSVPTLIDGGTGTNSLDYSPDGGAPANVNLQTKAASRIHAGAAGGFKAILHLLGSTGAGDLLVGPDAKSTWPITGANSGSIGGFTFAGVESLRGGSQNDVFRFNPGGSLQGAIDGGGGSNTLDYAADGGAAVTVNLQTHAASRLHGGAIGGFTHIQGAVGSTAVSDRLIGLNGSTLWQITGNNAGMAGVLAFSQFENLQGGTASDTFKFSSAGVVSGSIAGGGGGDWLDYSLFTTPVSVNLTSGVASRVGGAAAGKISQIQNVTGGSGSDILVGSSLGNILIGAGGNDNLFSGAGRSVLIGGTGGDMIKGGGASDLLLGGTTNFDSNHAALMSILKEWQRTDKTYAQRVADLKNGGGLNGANKLVLGTTVHDDGAADTLTGNASQDWFFANLGPGGVLDHITDRNNGGAEQVN
jgi:hypothetical protein